MSKEISIIKKRSRYDIHSECINNSGERRMGRLGSIVYRETTATYGYSQAWNVTSISVRALEEVVDFMKELEEKKR